MKVKVTNPLALRVAQAATARQDFLKVFQGVHIRPDGRVAGSDGFVLAYHPHAVEPFEGEAFIARLQSPLPKSAEDIEFDTDAEVVKYRMVGKYGRQPGAMAYAVIDATYPDVEEIAPTEGRVWSGSTFGLDFELVRRMWHAASAKSSSFRVQFTDKEVVRLVHWDDELVLLVMPTRYVGTGADLPLRVVEGAK